MANLNHAHTERVVFSPLGPVPMDMCFFPSSSPGHKPSGRATVDLVEGREVAVQTDISVQGAVIMTSSSSYESAIIGEAHGLISDMLADASLPPHVVSGLHAVSSLLKPPESHGPVHKPRVSPLVSLTETSNYGSDSEDLPYTGERPSSLPKRLRRSLPPSLIRRMSTSTWTTTTSATGLPTLEPEPCRTRSCSFRHSRDNTPGSSPTNSRSNSPSPSSPTTLSLTIPKSRSFSIAAGVPVTTATTAKRASRRSLLQPDTVKEGDGEKYSVSGISRRFNITSDYESSDSPSSSDHSDNVTACADDLSGAVLPGNQSNHCEEESTPATGGTATDTTGYRTDTDKVVDLSPDNPPPPTDSTPSQPDPAPHKPSSAPHKPSSALFSEAGQLVSEVDSASITYVQSEASSVDADTVLPFSLEDAQAHELLDVHKLNQWDYNIFDLSMKVSDSILSMVACRLFSETGLFETFRIPIEEFIQYFHALELGYREKPYHNRIHATDVLHGVYYLTTQPIPGFTQTSPDTDPLFSSRQLQSSSESDSETGDRCCARTNFTAEDTYGIMGGNLPPLELMALYAAAAMHDYDHPGRTNAFLVTTNAPLSILYNDRSVLESHHAASAWRLYLSNPRHHWLRYLDKAEFKRFRFLVIEAILATDLKRHFELLAEFNAKVNDDDAPGIDWTLEQDRLMVSNMVIKMADINGPCKRKDLHFNWTNRISEEFYEQGDEEASLGMPISPYMDRKHPQLAKLQESFINHLVAPLCNALGAAGLIPGSWIDQVTKDGEVITDDEKAENSSYKTTEDEAEAPSAGDSASTEKKKKRGPVRKMHCWLTYNLKCNHDMWVNVLKQEAAQKDSKAAEDAKKESRGSLSIENEAKQEMEPIQEEDTPPNSANSLGEDSTKASDRLAHSPHPPSSSQSQTSLHHTSSSSSLSTSSSTATK